MEWGGGGGGRRRRGDGGISVDVGYFTNVNLKRTERHSEHMSYHMSVISTKHSSYKVVRVVPFRGLNAPGEIEVMLLASRRLSKQTIQSVRSDIVDAMKGTLGQQHTHIYIYFQDMHTACCATTRRNSANTTMHSRIPHRAKLTGTVDCSTLSTHSRVSPKFDCNSSLYNSKKSTHHSHQCYFTYMRNQHTPIILACNDVQQHTHTHIYIYIYIHNNSNSSLHCIVSFRISGIPHSKKEYYYIILITPTHTMIHAHDQRDIRSGTHTCA